tara:strand:+ start:189 stop:638 length:450 start_codon:yes stop_codon:yes gene_type:complete
MAIIDTTRKPFIKDENTNVKIGIDLPIQLAVSGSDGYFRSTSTTIEAVKNNIENLIKTQKGERLMHPTLGLNLKKYLFEPFSNDVRDSITGEIMESFQFWLPFVNITNLVVDMDNSNDSVGKNRMNIIIDFNINKDPNSLESIQIEIGE